MEDKQNRLTNTDEDIYQMYSSAVLYYNNGDLHNAIMLLGNILNKKPDFAEAWDLLGNCYKMLGDTDSAQYCFQQAAKYIYKGESATYCPFCGTVVGDTETRCRGCGVVIVESEHEKASYRGFVLSRNELKRLGKIAEPGEKVLKGPPPSQVSEGSAYIPQQVVEEIPHDYQNSLVSQFPDYRSHTGVSAARFGFADANGLTFGRRKSRGVPGRIFVVPIIFLIMLVSSISFGLYNLSTMPHMKVDGNFDEWAGVSKYGPQTSHASVNPDIRIKEYTFAQTESSYFIYIAVEGRILAGNSGKVVDTVYIFIDTGPGSPGYQISGIFADFLIQVHGWNNAVYGCTLYRYDGTGGIEWNAWIQPVSIPAACADNKLELEIKKGFLGGSEKFMMYIATQSFDGTMDYIEHPAGNVPILISTTKSLLSDIVPVSQIDALEIDFQAVNLPANIDEITVHNTGTALPPRAFVKGYQNLDATIAGNRYVFKIQRKLQAGEHFLCTICTETTPEMQSCTLGFEIEPADIKTDAYVIINEQTSRSYAKIGYVGKAPDVTVDGAFGDWMNVTKELDVAGDVGNPSVDIREYAPLVRANTLFMYLDVAGMIFSGECIPYRNYAVVGGTYTPDSDRDTIPDAIDPYPFDFNNDGVPDGSTNNDVDNDGIKDYPYGNDYWLNTTIPDTESFPAEFRGKFVSVYIGPGILPAEVKGLDTLRIFMDTDRNRNTGMAISSIGADMLVEISGKLSQVIKKQVYRFESGTWVEAGNELQCCNDMFRVELSVVFGIATQPSLYIDFSDFWGKHDTAEMAGLKSIDVTSTATPVRDCTPALHEVDGDKSSQIPCEKQDSESVAVAGLSEQAQKACALQPKCTASENISHTMLLRYINAGKTGVARSGTRNIRILPATTEDMRGASNSGWIPDVNVSRASNYHAFSPVMATDSNNNIYTAFMFWSTAVSRWGIAVFRSTDSGITWSGLWWYFTNYDCDWPSLAISGNSGSYSNRLYLAFTMYSSSYMFIEVGYVDIANFATSTAWGWRQITSTSEYWDMPAITVMGNSVNSVYLAARYWYGNYDRDILGFRSDNGGITWNGATPPLTSSNAYQIRYTYEDSGVVYGPTVAWGTGTNLYCAYDDLGVTAARWNFNTDGNAEGWFVGNQLSALTVSGGILTTTATGSDPFMYSPSISIPAASYPYIHIYMRTTGSGTSTKIYFITSTDGAWNEAKSVTLPVNDHTNYVWYTFNMSQCAYWSGTITRLRFDIIDAGASSGDVYSIDMISVQSAPMNSIVWKSSDSGVTWSTGYILRPPGPDVQPSFAPCVAATHGGNTVVVASVYYKSSTDWDINISYSTDALSTMYVMAFSTEGTTQAWPALAADPVYGYFHMAYYDSGTYSIRYSRAYYTTPYSWSVPYASSYVSDGNSGDWEYRPGITYQWRNGGAAYYPCITWGDARGSYWNVYYSTPGSRTTITTSPSSLAISVDSLQYTAPVSFVWIAGYNHDLYAPSPQGTDIYAPRYVFSSWSDGGAQSHTITVLGFDMTITAYFTTQYYLRVISTYDTPTGENWYNAGTYATASVTSPVSGGSGIRYVCAGYTGTGSAPSGTGSSVSFYINAPSSVTFSWKTQYLLTLSTVNVTSSYPAVVYINGSSYATVHDTAPCDLWLDANLQYQVGVSAEIAGQPNTRWAFLRWAGGSTQNPLTVSLTNPAQITAEYLKQYYCTLTLNGLSSGAPAGISYQSFLTTYSVYSSGIWSAWVDHGSTITVTNEIYVSATERYKTTDQYAFVAISSPLSRTLTYRHQWYASITLVGTDAGHTVWANYTIDGIYYSQSGIYGSWSNWCDEGTTLSFSDTTTGTPPYTTTDPHAWQVNSAIVATIHYTTPVSENALSMLSVIILLIAVLIIVTREKCSKKCV